MKDKTLEELLDEAQSLVKTMTPAEYAAMLRRQRESWVRGEMAIGSDADEEAYRAQMRRDDELH